MHEAHRVIIEAGSIALSQVKRYGNYAKEHPEINQTVLQHVMAMSQLSNFKFFHARRNGFLNEHFVNTAILTMYLGHGVYAPGYDIPHAERTDEHSAQEYTHFQNLIEKLPEDEKRHLNEAYLLQWCYQDESKKPPAGLPKHASETIKHMKVQFSGEAAYVRAMVYCEAISFARQMHKQHGHLTMLVQVLRNAVTELNSLRRGRDVLYSVWSIEEHEEALAFLKKHDDVPEEQRVA